MDTDDLDRAFGHNRKGPPSAATVSLWKRLHPTTYETNWLTSVRVMEVIGEVPRPTVIAGGTTSDVRYYSEGRLRPDDPSCVLHLTRSGTGTFHDVAGEHRTRPGSCYLFRANDPRVSYW
ncbi:MAG TPA: hypothetical protein VK324_11355 [Tepidisphaeraceae bacterium]|nr:hypothetical protein [Tepidisphaeraceae bacterium]